MMNTSGCHSCGIPFGASGMKPSASNANLCQNCADEKGNLKPREEVQQGLAMWLASWSPKASREVFLRRADHYMAAMPSWAKD